MATVTPEQCATSAALPASRRRESWLSRYIWLVYSGFFFLQPVQRPTLREWAMFVPFYCAFLFCYIYPDFNRRSARWCILGLAVLGLVYTPVNPGVAGIFIFVAAFLPFFVENVALCLGLIVAASGLVAGEGIYFHAIPWIWGPVAFFSIIVGVANLTHAREKRSIALLLRAQEENQHLAAVAERERIARDLHDVLGHTLSMITLKAELAGKLLASDPARAAIEIADVEQTARRALAEVREAVGGYRALGLQAEFARTRQTLASAGVELEADTPPHQLPPAEETVLALIVREAVTNIVRHAQATECRVRFVTGTDQILLIIRDNGRGGSPREGNGLRGMRERAEALGGEFSWACGDASKHGQKNGMELRITLPLREKALGSAPGAKPSLAESPVPASSVLAQ